MAKGLDPEEIIAANKFTATLGGLIVAIEDEYIARYNGQLCDCVEYVVHEIED